MSIGAPRSCTTANPARSRTLEWRPSAPTTSFAATCNLAVWSGRAHAGHAAIGFDQLVAFGLHHQMECRIFATALGQEVQEIPLRHQRDELAVGWETREIRDLDRRARDSYARSLELVVRKREKVVEPTQLVKKFQRRRMHGIAAKIAEEVRIFLQDDHVDAGTRQQDRRA